jgi:predicted transcriptional regulator
VRRDVAATSPGRPRGGLERQVLACLAAAARPLTAGDVLADLGGGLAYTTVMTTLTRLHAKGALTRELTGRAYAYALPGDAADVGASVTATRMRRLLEAGEDRAGVLAHFVADLSAEDERLLAEVLASGGRGGPA